MIDALSAVVFQVQVRGQVNNENAAHAIEAEALACFIPKDVDGLHVQQSVHLKLQLSSKSVKNASEEQ